MRRFGWHCPQGHSYVTAMTPHGSPMTFRRGLSACRFGSRRGSQRGSQRGQTARDTRRRPATMVQVRWLIRRRPATARDGQISPEKRKVTTFDASPVMVSPGVASGLVRVGRSGQVGSNGRGLGRAAVSGLSTADRVPVVARLAQQDEVADGCGSTARPLRSWPLELQQQPLVAACQPSMRTARSCACRQSSAARKACSWDMARSVPSRQSRISSPKNGYPTRPDTGMCCSPCLSTRYT